MPLTPEYKQVGTNPRPCSAATHLWSWNTGSKIAGLWKRKNRSVDCAFSRNTSSSSKFVNIKNIRCQNKTFKHTGLTWCSFFWHPGAEPGRRGSTSIFSGVCINMLPDLLLDVLPSWCKRQQTRNDAAFVHPAHKQNVVDTAAAVQLLYASCFAQTFCQVVWVTFADERLSTTLSITLLYVATNRYRMIRPISWQRTIPQTRHNSFF